MSCNAVRPFFGSAGPGTIRGDTDGQRRFWKPQRSRLDSIWRRCWLGPPWDTPAVSMASGRNGPTCHSLLRQALDALGREDSILRATLLGRLAGALRDQPSLGPRASLGREAVEMARRIGDPVVVLRPHRSMGGDLPWP